MAQTWNQQVERTDQQPAIPPLPPWPTSKPGPQITEAPPGQKRLPRRPEQVVEVDYDEEHGKSAVRSEEK